MQGIRIVTALMFLASALRAASPVAGDWIGTLKPGPVELRLLLHIKDTGTALQANMDSLDQGVKGIAIDSIALTKQTLTFEVGSIQGRYEGKFDDTAQTIRGTWTQAGATLELNLARYVEKPKAARTGGPAKPSDIDGAWEGKLDVGGQTLRIVLHVKTGEDGDWVVTLDSPDQGGFGLPATAVAREGSTLRAEFKGIGATYKGTIDSAKNKIDGAFTQGAELPLVLERKK